MDDGLFISQNKSFDISNSCLFCSYNVIIKLLNKFGLIVEHFKTKVFHFNRLHGFFNTLPLDSSIGGSVLTLKSSWKYLGFIFNRKLSFHQHIDFYSNRAMSMVKCMKVFENSLCSIIPTQKYLLYKCYVLFIALYGFQLWFYNCTPLLYLLKVLGKMQRRATIWITGAFKTSPLEDIEAIADLILIKLYFQKLVDRSQLCTLSLPPNYLIWTLMKSFFGSPKYCHPASLNSLTSRQRSHVKGYLVNSDNKSNGIFSFFSPLHLELSLGFRIIDNFSDCFSFNLSNNEKNDKICL